MLLAVIVKLTDVVFFRFPLPVIVIVAVPTLTLFEYDNVELEFEKEALESIVDKAIERKTGARGLRSIIEETMTDIMFEIPSNSNIEKCTITKQTVLEKKEPELVINEFRENTTNKLEEEKNTKRKIAGQKNKTA